MFWVHTIHLLAIYYYLLRHPGTLEAIRPLPGIQLGNGFTPNLVSRSEFVWEEGTPCHRLIFLHHVSSILNGNNLGYTPHVQIQTRPNTYGSLHIPLHPFPKFCQKTSNPVVNPTGFDMFWSKVSYFRDQSISEFRLPDASQMLLRWPGCRWLVAIDEWLQ